MSRAWPILAFLIILLSASFPLAQPDSNRPADHSRAQAAAVDPETLPDFQDDPVERWGGRVLTWTLVVALGLVLLAMVRVARGRAEGTSSRALLLACVVVLPTFCLSVGMLLVLVRAERVEFCGSCHRALASYVADMRDPESVGLAAVHYRYQYIASNQCYECHTSYGLFGTAVAKVNGIRQVMRYYSGGYEFPLKMWRPYGNEDCLKCHARSVRWLSRGEHTAEGRARELIEGRASCMDCHKAGHSDRVKTREAT